MKKHNLTQINQIPRLTSSAPAESYSAPLDSLPRASFSGPPPGESGGATNLNPFFSIHHAIVKELSNYSECTQKLAVEEMLSRLKKESAND